MGSDDSQMNDTMMRLIPELGSKYARYPLKGKAWLDPSVSSISISGEEIKSFIPYKKDPLVDTANVTIKMDYVWGPGPRGFGYYHLLTRDAYVTLSARIRSDRANAPTQCFACCSREATKKYNEYEDVKTIVYNRSVASIPDDSVAQRDAIAIATSTAKIAYNTSQDIQLFMMMHD